MKKVWLLALVGIVALAAGGCDVFNDLGGRDNLPKTPQGLPGKIELNGGAASLRAGGNGGSLAVETMGLRSIHVLPSGTVDDAINVPDLSPALDLGTNPWEVTVDTTLSAYSDHTAADEALAEYYLLVGGNTVYQAAEGGPAAVTGLKVDKGQTLFLEVNIFNGATPVETSMAFESDVEVLGTIEAPLVLAIDMAAAGVMPADALLLNRAGLVLVARQIFIRHPGVIASQGLDAPLLSGLAGGNGGCLELWGWLGVYNAGRIEAGGGAGDGVGDGGSGAVCSTYGGTGLMGPTRFGPGSGVTLETEIGPVINVGPISADGGEGANGGLGGAIGLSSGSKVFNTAELSLNGGLGLTGKGGDGGAAVLISLLGAYNQGGIFAAGGDGTAGDGGRGGYIELILDSMGPEMLGAELINRGELFAEGGQSQTGIGGAGGDLIVENLMGGDVVSNARITLNGGDGDTLGGSGGRLEFGSITIAIPVLPPGSELPESNVTIRGDLLLNGGAGKTGGNAGSIDIGGPGGILSASLRPAGAITPKMVVLPQQCSIHLVGYSSVNFNGGAGGNGGNGGRVMLFDPTGEVASATDYQGRGGLGFDGLGGAGGGFELYSGYYMADYFGPGSLANPLAALTSLGAVAGQSGNVDLRGGDGFTQGGRGGGGLIGGDDGAAVSGIINVSGGDGIGENALGGNASYLLTGAQVLPQSDLIDGFLIVSPYGVVGIEGALIGNGGNATGLGTAGFGAFFEVLAGEKITSRADYSARGGNADLALGIGGDGGVVELISIGDSTSHQGAARVNGGQGLVPGENGFFVIDGILIK